MKKLAIYGLPLNPQPLLEELAGASFCVSYGTRDKLGRQLDQALNLVGQDGMVLVDNGAFSNFQAGRSSLDLDYVEGFEAWAETVLARCPQAVAVIPDMIGGTEAENRQLAHETMIPWERAMFVWHLNESLDQLLWACDSFEWVAFGSAGEYWTAGTPAWHARVAEAFAAIDAWELAGEGANLRPRIHMMRAQAQAHAYPFDSSDSCNVAVNHGRYRAQGQGHVGRFAQRAAAKILASSGPEAEHQIKRPIVLTTTKEEA